MSLSSESAGQPLALQMGRESVFFSFLAASDITLTVFRYSALSSSLIKFFNASAVGADDSGRGVNDSVDVVVAVIVGVAVGVAVCIVVVVTEVVVAVVVAADTLDFLEERFWEASTPQRIKAKRKRGNLSIGKLLE